MQIRSEVFAQSCYVANRHKQRRLRIILGGGNMSQATSATLWQNKRLRAAAVSTSSFVVENVQRRTKQPRRNYRPVQVDQR